MIEPVLLKKIVEGALFAAGQPLNEEQLGFLFDEADRPDVLTLRAILEELVHDYAEKGVELKEVATGFRFQVRQETGPWVSRLWDEKPSRYSRALLETLALMAYRQPITRSEIEEIRGVSVSSHIVKTLLERDWIRVAGHRDVPGRPALFATTRDFLNDFNLKSLAELPSLSEIRDLDKINEELEFLEAQGAEEVHIDQLAVVMAEFEEDPVVDAVVDAKEDPSYES
jgi:segregation and condensation protein B